MQRETMEYDVVIVGAGPSGLAAACRLKQLDPDVNVCVLEKGAEVGAHIISGAIIEPKAISELFPDWRELGAPIDVQVTEEEVHFLVNNELSVKTPAFAIPAPMRNHGNYIASLGNVCRWMAKQAENLGVDIFTGFAATEILLDDNLRVIGVVTGDRGADRDGLPKATFQPGVQILAKYTLFAEGCRGHLGKQLISRFRLNGGRDPQHYGIGIKEIWQVEPSRHRKGKIIHGAGWPLIENGATGGFFLYHADDNQVLVGLITDLNYANPHLSPYEEFQRLKHHPIISEVLTGGQRLSYGARAVAKGGLHSLPKMVFPGGLLIGCDAGTLNFSKIKGSHTAMKSGMLAAEVIIDTFVSGSLPAELALYEERFKRSWLHDELFASRNFGSAMHTFGTFVGAAYNFADQNIMKGRIPLTLHDSEADHTSMKTIARVSPIQYPMPDGKLSFSRLDSVYLSNTHHEENQPCHLKLLNDTLPMQFNMPHYGEPAQHYCPAGVYEIVNAADKGRYLQINAQNCLHCKTCDIKDPCQNIQWTAPEGGDGPQYVSM